MSLFIEVAKHLIKDDSKGVVRLLQDAGRSAIISALGLGGSPFGPALSTLLRAAMRDGGRGLPDGGGGKMSAAKKRAYSRSHAEWMAENNWRFDWRSQPRRPAGTEAGGEWMEGRLDYPVAVKYHVSRRERQRRTRAIKAYKARQVAAGNMNTRKIRTSWGEY
jgi:hypothetical protein